MKGKAIKWIEKYVKVGEDFLRFHKSVKNYIWLHECEGLLFSEGHNR